MGLVAAIQLRSTADIAENLQRILHWTALAAKRGAQLVVFPENCLYFGAMQDPSLNLATLQKDAARDLHWLKPSPSTSPRFTLDSSEILQIQAAADAHQIEVVLGSIPQAISESADMDDGRCGNTLMVLYPRSPGREQRPQPVCYRKMHLFDVTLQNGESYNESSYHRAGDEVVLARSRIGMLGLSICYDLRFPELYRALINRGAEVLLVPAAFTYQTGQDHWQTLVRARAIENLAFVVAPAQVGSPYKGRQVWGHSLIVDPWGNVLATSDKEQEELLLAELNLDYQRHIRQIFPALSNRKLFTERA